MFPLLVSHLFQIIIDEWAILVSEVKHQRTKYLWSGVSNNKRNLRKIPSWKLTCPPKFWTVPNGRTIFFRGHVSFRGCTYVKIIPFRMAFQKQLFVRTPPHLPLTVAVIAARFIWRSRVGWWRWRKVKNVVHCERKDSGFSQDGSTHTHESGWMNTENIKQYQRYDCN